MKISLTARTSVDSNHCYFIVNCISRNFTIALGKTYEPKDFSSALYVLPERQFAVTVLSNGEKSESVALSSMIPKRLLRLLLYHPVQ